MSKVNESDSKNNILRNRKFTNNIQNSNTSISIDDTTYIEDEDPDYTGSQSAYSDDDDEEEEDYDDDKDLKDDIDDINTLNTESTSSQNTLLLNKDQLESIKQHTTNIENEIIPNDSTTSLSSNLKSKTKLLLESHKKFGNFIHKHEIPRKVFHTSIGFITIFLYLNNIQTYQIRNPLLIGFIIMFSIDLLRLNSSKINKLYCKYLGFLMREKEINTYNGVLWYLLGLIIVFSIYKKDICLMSVFLLSWSDTAASTFGRAYGHLTPKIARGKSLAGSIAAFITGVFASYLLYNYLLPNFPLVNNNIYSDLSYNKDNNILNIHFLSLLSGLIAAVSEGIDLFNWDDNFTIPVLSSGFLWIVLKLTSTN
ncbi:hypothetical protein B5S28_g4383 [[Candida] boidinii]|uniref:Unnamed protein product n=1 Tax=Candida boidinii TaxID=5477 RepID=A0ACB5U307_CANBO|nr:hypothetical protein B5S28_g4383 [[Candida] boidinii]OWB61223.1 hypothetical protein B5S29_g2110 [[Candida] boidinii]OWB71815.1 hypothetical protein B5S31_g1510 [[Candida] boidinii]OWB77752.1 hypothetical protein B5S32_g1927 [[Candida] boidinii]GMF00275.1 unnamed protein product [[Candida] boidinii]